MTRTTFTQTRCLAALLALAGAAAAGCDDDTSGPAVDASVSPDLTATVVPQPDLSTPAPPPDMSQPPVGEDGGTVDPHALTPHLFPLSTAGHDHLYGTIFDAQGNLYAVGQIAPTTDATADFSTVIAKFTKTGALDTTFGTGGTTVRNVAVGSSGSAAELFRSIVLQSTGKLVVVGTVQHPGTEIRDRDIALMRFNSDGTKDTTFGAGGTEAVDGVVTINLSTGVLNGTAFLADSAWDIQRYPNDRLVVSGGRVRDAANALDTDFAIIRLTADGLRDTTFGTNGVYTRDTEVVAGTSNNASPRSLTILPGTDGIIGAGYQPIPGHDTGPVLLKVTDSGTTDTTFGTNGVFSTQVLAEQTECYQAVVQPDAVGTGYKLVTTGYGRALSTETTDLVSLRVTSAGVLDTTYGSNGLVRIDIGGFGDNSRKLAVLADRRIILTGGGRLTSANVDGLVAILLPDGVPDTTFAPKGWRTVDLGGPADFLWGMAVAADQKTAAFVGFKGVGNAPAAGATDDAALVLLSLVP